MTRTTAGWVLFAAAIVVGVALDAASEKAVTLQRVDVTRLPAVEVYLTVTDPKGDSVLGLTDAELSVSIA